MKLFITGGTGFWGKNILKCLLDGSALDFSEMVVLTRNHKAFLAKYQEQSVKFMNLLQI